MSDQPDPQAADLEARLREAVAAKMRERAVNKSLRREFDEARATLTELRLGRLDEDSAAELRMQIDDLAASNRLLVLERAAHEMDKNALLAGLREALNRLPKLGLGQKCWFGCGAVPVENPWDSQADAARHTAGCRYVALRELADVNP